MTVRHLKFWGKCWLENMGVMLGAGCIMFLFVAMGSADISSGGGLGELLGLYPYYLLLAGIFVTVMTMNYFQVQFSILLSMSVTRRSIIKGMLICVTASVLGPLALAALIWRLVPGDVSASGWELLPLLAGVLFLSAGFFLSLGLAVFRWGKNGAIVLMIVGVVVGGCTGLGFSILFDKGMMLVVDALTGHDFTLAAVIGIVVYLAAIVFVSVASRKLEARS